MKKTISFVTGIVAGAALGLLLAPSNGIETRRRIREEANKFVDEMSKLAKEHSPVK